jgi:two-component system response regulator FixJ
MVCSARSSGARLASNLSPKARSQPAKRPASERETFLVNNDFHCGEQERNIHRKMKVTSRKCVAIVDDDEAVRLSTADLIQRLGFDTKLFKSGEVFLESADLAEISCILLDFQMPGRDGLAVLRALAERGDSPPVLVLTAHGGIPAAVEAIKLGAHDFMEKPYDADVLLAKIGEAMQQSPGVQGAGGVKAEAVALVAVLSGRQRQVLHGIVRGLQNKIIAYELGLSIRTVEAYRAQLMERLGARGTAEAVRVAIAAGIMDDPAFP